MTGHRTRSDALTPRELQILTLTAEGLTAKEIARDLALTPHTINNYMATIHDKLGTKSRTETVVTALRRHLIYPNMRRPSTETPTPA